MDRKKSVSNTTPIFSTLRNEPQNLNSTKNIGINFGEIEKAMDKKFDLEQHTQKVKNKYDNELEIKEANQIIQK